MESCGKHGHILSFGNAFILTGILIQIVTFMVNDIGWISLVSGCAGVIAVVLCSQRRFISVPFSFVQLLTYIYLSYNERLWAEVGINLFYLVLMIFTAVSWKRNRDPGSGIVEARRLGKEANAVSVISMVVMTTLLYWVLDMTDDSQPLLDALSTGPAIVAQVLMMFRCREQWFYWIAIDLVSVVMWANAGDACMVVQYVFWTVNCIYGYKMWSVK